MSLQKNIRDLIFFYVKTNYDQYLKENNIQFIPEDKIDHIIHTLYDERKEHIQEFIKSSLKELYQSKSEEYPGDLIILNILVDIFNDDDLCKNRLTMEIKLHQQKIKNDSQDYHKLL